MNWEQAKKAMRDGKKVSHCCFTPDEYFTMRNGTIFCELGYPMTGWYKGEDWQDSGWSVIN